MEFKTILHNAGPSTEVEDFGRMLFVNYRDKASYHPTGSLITPMD
jgi:hypothetical protein